MTHKQMFWRLQVAPPGVQAGSTSEKLINKICLIIYSLYQAKEITLKVYNNIMNSIKVKCKVDTIFTNSKYSNIYEPHRLLQINKLKGKW